MTDATLITPDVTLETTEDGDQGGAAPKNNNNNAPKKPAARLTTAFQSVANAKSENTTRQPLTPGIQMAQQATNFMQVLFTLINKMFGIKKMNGLPYDEVDYDVAYTAFFGHSPYGNSGANTSSKTTPGPASPAAEQPKTAAPTADKAHISSVTDVSIENGKRIYTAKDDKGCEFKFAKSGGSVSWMNNNPGMIKETDIKELVKDTGKTEEDFRKTFGVLGKDENDVLIFADMPSGVLAQIFHTQATHPNMTMADAVAELAVNTEKGTAYYTGYAKKSTGIDENKKISEFTPEEMGKFARVAAKIDGLESGKIEIYHPNGITVSPETIDRIERDQDAPNTGAINLTVEWQETQRKGGIDESRKNDQVAENPTTSVVPLPKPGK